MPKATTKSPQLHPENSSSHFTIALNNFLETGHFILTDEVVTTDALEYMLEYLAEEQAAASTHLDYRLYLDNVIFDIETPENFSHRNPRECTDDALIYLLDKILAFSPKWSVIGLDNVTILQGESYYPLSFYFIWYLAPLIVTPAENSKTGRKELIATKELIITHAEFHPWVWNRVLPLSQLNRLTFELLPNADQAENLLHLCDVLRYVKLKCLNLGETQISLEGYRALHELLAKNYFIEKMIIKKPTDPESLEIFNQINERLPEGRTGKQRFDRLKFNQAEFLRYLFNAQRALENETDPNEIDKQKKIIEFLLIKKTNTPFPYQEYRSRKIKESGPGLDVSFFKPDANLSHMDRYLNGARHVDSVYFDHAEYLDGRWPSFTLDLATLVDTNSRTLGYRLLKEALDQNDSFMVEQLIKAGANLFEQQDDEKPLLIQIYEKNKAFKIIVLKYIHLDEAFENTVEHTLRDYSVSKNLMIDIVKFFKRYAKILNQRAQPHLLSDFKKLFNLFKDIAHISRPSKNRDQEFLEIYSRIYQCLILFQDDQGKVTTEYPVYLRCWEKSELFQMLPIGVGDPDLNCIMVYAIA